MKTVSREDLFGGVQNEYVFKLNIQFEDSGFVHTELNQCGKAVEWMEKAIDLDDSGGLWGKGGNSGI